MDDNEMRVEALKLAIGAPPATGHPHADGIVATAETFYRFLRGGPVRAPETKAAS